MPDEKLKKRYGISSEDVFNEKTGLNLEQLRAYDDKLLRERAYFLWDQAGQPVGRDEEFWDRAQNELFGKVVGGIRNDALNANRIYPSVYRRDATINAKEALGFLKDWITSLISLQTAALGVIGAVVALTGASSLNESVTSQWQVWVWLQWCAIGLTALAFLVSIFFGTQLLNALPGAAQRVPTSAGAQHADVFSVANEPRSLTISAYSLWVRSGFVTGLGAFLVFLILRVLTCSFNHCSTAVTLR